MTPSRRTFLSGLSASLIATVVIGSAVLFWWPLFLVVWKYWFA